MNFNKVQQIIMQKAWKKTLTKLRGSDSCNMWFATLMDTAILLKYSAVSPLEMHISNQLARLYYYISSFVFFFSFAFYLQK